MSQLPEQLKYTATHEWLEQTGNEARVGITDHAQQLLGDLVFVELPEIGKTVAAGETLGVLESVKAASDYYAPVSGVVTAVNQVLVDHPELLNQDPYGKAWLVQLTINDSAEQAHLLSASQYAETIAGEH